MARDPDLSHIIIRDAYLTAKKLADTCFGLGEWRRYGTGIWAPIHEQQVRGEIQSIAEGKANAGLGVQVNHNLITSVYQMLKSKTFVPDSAFNADTNLLAFDDCVVHLTTRAVSPHAARYYFTSKLPFAYDPTAGSTVWQNFLKETAPECSEFLQEFAGYCLTTSTEYETALWLHGPPGGGKSTFIVGLQAMLGSRACVLGLSELVSSNFALTNLPGKTLAVSAEQPADYISTANTINNLISGETITVNRKYKDPIELTPHAKFIWAMNELPRATALGLFRRVKVVHFPGVPIEARNPRVKESIAASGMAITNWALNGLDRLQARGRFLIPASVEEASEEYRIANDVPLLFLTECCEPAPDERVPASQLYAAYVKWCKTNGHYPESSTKFGTDMTRLGILPRKSSITYRLGVLIKPGWDDPTDEILGEYGRNTG